MSLYQLVILICGVSSAYLSQTEPLRRYACLFGIVAQPAWMHATWVAHQYGIFMLSFAYSAIWLKGLWVHWLRQRWVVA